MASIWAELEIKVTGTVTPGYPATRDDPGDGGSVEDIDISDVLLGTVNLLEGVDLKSAAWQVFAANVIAARLDLAVEAIMEDEDPAGDAADAAYERYRDEVGA